MSTASAEASRARRALPVALGLAVVLGGSVLAGTAAGQAVECGAVIREDVRLTADLGPCSGDGLVVAADGVTVDLGGHTISADPLGEHNTVGLILRKVEGVTVRNGTVEGFDAGIVIRGGAGNTISGVTAQDNVNRRKTDPCLFGDGIVIFDSDDNRVQGNRVLRNGPFSGISLVRASSGNVVEGNRLEDNNIPNWIVPGVTGACGALPGSPLGMRNIQAVGIRVEGPGATRNVVRANTVINSALAGIALHGHVCNPPEDYPTGPEKPNTRNVITRNVVRETGRDTSTLDPPDPVADGIAVFRQGPLDVVCTAHSNVITHNRVIENFRHGIHLGATTRDNIVSHNVALDNMFDGLSVDGAPDNPEYTGAVENTFVGNRGRGNGGYDGADYNEDCDDNRWRESRFEEVNQDCVRG